MILVIDNCNVELSIVNASSNGTFHMTGKVFTFSDKHSIIFRVYHDRHSDEQRFGIDFCGGAYHQEHAIAMLNAVKVAETLMHKYTKMLADAVADKAEHFKIVSMIKAKEYDLAKMHIDMTDICLTNLTSRARSALPEGCESVLDAILREEAFKPALAVFKKRYGVDGTEQIDDAEKPLLALAESVFNGYKASLFYIEMKDQKERHAAVLADFIKFA